MPDPASATPRMQALLRQYLAAGTEAERAQAAEEAMGRLAHRTLESPETCRKDGFMCIENEYGGSASTYLTNSQGLVGVLLAAVESSATILTPADWSRVIGLSRPVLNEVLRAELDEPGPFLGLAPYVTNGDLEKLLGGAPADGRRAFTTYGASWALSALLLLYVAGRLGRVNLEPALAEELRRAIVTGYGLLRRTFLEAGDAAGWGWCSRSTTPDVYHTWSCSQTLGDLDDYVLRPSGTPELEGDPYLIELRAELSRVWEVPALDAAYAKCCRWLHRSLEDPARFARDALLAGGNAPENLIYYRFLVIEALVYMRADEVLARDEAGEERLRADLKAELLRASDDLRALRDRGDWYNSPDGRDVLTIPLPPFPGMGEVKKGAAVLLREPSLEPLVVRALTYGRLYLGGIRNDQLVREAVAKHAVVLDVQKDLWDVKGINFLINERTVEMLEKLAGMHRATAPAAPSAPAPTGPSPAGEGLALRLTPDSLEALVERVAQRLGDRAQNHASAAPTRPPPSPDPLVLQLVDPLTYEVMLADDQATRAALQREPGTPASDPAHQFALQQFDTVGLLVERLLRAIATREEGRDPKERLRTLEEALRDAVARLLPDALSVMLESYLRQRKVPALLANLAKRGDKRGAALPLLLMLYQFVERDLKQVDRLDVAAIVEKALQGAKRTQD